MSANVDQDARQERVGRDQKLKGVEACRDGGGVLSVGRLWVRAISIILSGLRFLEGETALFTHLLRLERVQESIRELLGPDEEKWAWLSGGLTGWLMGTV